MLAPSARLIAYFEKVLCLAQVGLDSVITTMVKARLAQEKMSTLTKIQVDTDRNGAVFLSGKSKTQARTKKYRLPMQPRV